MEDTCFTISHVGSNFCKSWHGALRSSTFYFVGGRRKPFCAHFALVVGRTIRFSLMGPEILESSSKKLGLKFWRLSDEEKSTPGIGNVPKVRQSEGISSSKKIGPTLWKWGGGSGNSGIHFQKVRPEVLEVVRRGGPSTPGVTRLPKVPQSEGGGLKKCWRRVWGKGKN